MEEIMKISIGWGRSEQQHHLQLDSVQIKGNFKITLIERDEDYLRLNGESRFTIWVQEIDEDRNIIGKMQRWQVVERQPVMITYTVSKGLLLDKKI